MFLQTIGRHSGRQSFASKRSQRRHSEPGHFRPRQIRRQLEQREPVYTQRSSINSAMCQPFPCQMGGRDDKSFGVLAQELSRRIQQSTIAARFYIPDMADRHSFKSISARTSHP
ncbi:MAG TPA: hypothetical protein VKX39_06545 [Bryobacteraceae bacterium]|nr:hypothetical protein [Bryobacteraceae bacterium]